ncbi:MULTISPECIES: AAA family ATPase [unclassified Microcoleus]|uniref:AAA family ATPase n=1 Tax=unclassified Microcoleus TaxID=2642155 RepID=UPI002FD5804C
MNAVVDLTNRISGYHLGDQLYCGSRTLVYRAIRETDQLPVVIKLLNRDYPSFSELLQFRNQYTIAKNLSLPGVVEPYNLESYRHSYALVMEDFGGISLRDYAQEHSLTLAEVLEIAIQITDILDALYRNRVIHKDIKPANILIHPETKQIKLIDFSIASLLPRETQEIQNPNVLEGTLAYISPEQTGRMNRGIDYRTDFYSLGVTFYELLTGKLPFECEDPMELVHCHIAKQPPAINSKEIPQVVSDIVMKLMAKNAEKRYQSALGLKHDLERCLQQCQETGKIETFELGRRDVCDRFLIPEKLYGRETEVKTLLSAFDRVASGTSELMLVAGFSGIGKTAVVNEVHKPIVRQRGYFIKGKFDQFNRNIPFSAFVQAFRDFMAQLLSESDAKLKAWKNKILEAVGENGQVIIEIIPELEKIIGQQPAALELSGTAAQNRFNLLFQKFTKVFTSLEHPFVMFLDDLQWADSASLKLMQVLMGDTGHLLLIGAYRDNEVHPAHPLMLTLSEIQKTPATINRITLAALNKVTVNQLVADTLKCTESLAWTLSGLIYQKTQGNPFFATQFIKALHQDELIYFNWEEGCWQCDIAQVNQLVFTDDIVSFMALQLEKLPTSTQQVLQLAACIGNQFDLATLAMVSEQSQTEVAASLWKALQEGLILAQSEVYKFYVGEEYQLLDPENSEIVAYRFLHDRVQQAAYSLIPADEKQTVHLKIGQLILSNTLESNREERIFEIVSQLNVAAESIVQSAERQRLAQFNLMASRKAKAAIAYTAACKYAEVGIGLLTQNSWQHQYELTLALYQVATETAYLSGDLEKMAANARLVLKHAKSPLDQISVYEVKIEAFTAQGHFTQAIAAALAILKQLGVELPAAPTQEDVAAAFSTVSDAIGERLPGELLNLSEARDVNILAAARILTSAAPGAYLSQPLLYLLVILKKVYLSIVYGNESTSTFCYASYGILMCGVLGKVELGYEFGQLALDLLSRYPNSELKGKTLSLVYVYTRHWKMHLRETLQPLQMAYCSCLDVGDLAFAGYSAYNYGFYSYFAGQNLTQLEPEVAGYCESLKHLKQNLTLTYSQLNRQILLNLMGDADNVVVLSGAAYNEQHQLPLHETTGDRTGLALLWINKLIVSYLFSEFEEAVEQAGQARQYLDAVLAFLYVPIFHFYESLVQLAWFGQFSDPEEQQMKECVAANQEKLKYWATYAPMNFLHKFHLVEAERERVQGNKAEALELYDRAIAGAKENEYLQEEALANELAAKFYLDWGKEKVAASYMQESYYCYARWGAKAKVEHLEQSYPQLLHPILNQPKLRFNPLETLVTISQSSHISTTSSTSISDALDFASIVQAAQALSSKIHIDELLDTLNQIILKTSGAETCALLLPHRDEWQIRAITHINPDNELPTTLLQTQSIDGSEMIPLKLVYYVKHTLETVVIEGGKTDIPGLMNDCTLQYHSQSMLCTPIIDRGNLVAILYLEHSSTKGVFTRDRLLILNFLCTQAAISLENARLYQQAQDYAHQVEQSQLQLVQSEKMSALGNLVAGVAHEINNPVGFISGNIHEAIAAVKDITEYLQLYQEKFPSPGEEIEEKAEEIDIEYLLEDLPKMLHSMQVGCDRIQGISTSLRTFSRTDKDYKVSFNIHDGINSTILILKHRLKANEQRPAIEVVKEYGNLPSVDCFPGQLNQVFMNILANAIDALEESNREPSLDKIKTPAHCITIRTERQSSEWVSIRIYDNGTGIADEIKCHIFDHLFTTKGVGKGTGLGLAIARQIVVEKHGGKIEVNSVLGEGTEFTILLPTNG